MQMTFTLGPSAPTKVCVIERLELVNVSLDMKVSHVSALFAPTNAVNTALAGQKSFLLRRLEEHILYLGMRTSMLDVCATLVTVDLLVTCASAHLVGIL